jgi:hypothetical protein
MTGARIAKKTSTYIGKNERIICLRDHIVVKPDRPQWSPIIQVEWKGQHLKGTVVAVGPGCWPNLHARGKKDGKDWRTIRPSKAFRPTELHCGDVVELGGSEIGGYLFESIMIETDDGLTEHVVCREADVAAVHYGSP